MLFQISGSGCSQCITLPSNMLLKNIWQRISPSKKRTKEKWLNNNWHRELHKSFQEAWVKDKLGNKAGAMTSGSKEIMHGKVRGLQGDSEPAGRHHTAMLPSAALNGQQCGHGQLFHLSGPLPFLKAADDKAI